MVKAMFAPTPPRRTRRSSTRKLSEILSSASGRMCSAKRPGKCIRWSVAMEPVTMVVPAVMGFPPSTVQSEHDGRSAVDQYPVGTVPGDRAREDGSFDVGSATSQFRCTCLMRHAHYVLLDDRPFVQIGGRVVRGGADELDSPAPRLFVGSGTGEGGQERMV